MKSPQHSFIVIKQNSINMHVCQWLHKITSNVCNTQFMLEYDTFKNIVKLVLYEKLNNKDMEIQCYGVIQPEQTDGKTYIINIEKIYVLSVDNFKPHSESITVEVGQLQIKLEKLKGIHKIQKYIDDEYRYIQKYNGCINIDNKFNGIVSIIQNKIENNNSRINNKEFNFVKYCLNCLDRTKVLKI